MATSKRSVLYLDDEVTCLKVFQHLFCDEYDVRTAANLDEARRALAECSPDIVISDQAMPEISGTDFLREVSRTYPLSFRMILSGNICVGSALSEISSGLVNLFMAKPWTEAQMRCALERAFMSRPNRACSVSAEQSLD